MSLLTRLKSFLGMGEDDERESQTTDISVETRSEDAVKGTDSSAASNVASTDASADTETLVDEDEGYEPAEVVGEADTDTGPAAEPAEATGPVAEEPEPEVEEAEPEAEEAEADEEMAEEADEEPEADETDDEALGTDEPTSVIKGIGPSYAETLAEAGVETVADLAAADPAALAEETGISEKRLERWVGRAQHR